MSGTRHSPIGSAPFPGRRQLQPWPGLVEGAELSPNWRLIDVFSMPFELVYRIFGEPGNFPELSTVNVVAVNAAWTIGGLAVVGWRYSRLVVAR